MISAPDKYTGAIGKLIATDVWKLPLKPFKKLDIDFPRLPEEVLLFVINDVRP